MLIINTLVGWLMKPLHPKIFFLDTSCHIKVMSHDYDVTLQLLVTPSNRTTHPATWHKKKAATTKMAATQNQYDITLISYEISAVYS